jgi:CspA family cold shock protein
MPTGTVRWWDDERSFGVLSQDGGGEDVLCHHTAILADGCFKLLAAGQRLEFQVCESPEGLVATNVRRVFDERGVLVTVLCGDAVQIRTRSWGRPDLGAAAERLGVFGEVRACDYLVRLRAPPHEMTLFDDGRAIVKGTNDAALARSLVGRWLGVRIPEAVNEVEDW